MTTSALVKYKSGHCIDKVDVDFKIQSAGSFGTVISIIYSYATSTIQRMPFILLFNGDITSTA
jgi:hypothetical protein